MTPPSSPPGREFINWTLLTCVDVWKTPPSLSFVVEILLKIQKNCELTMLWKKQNKVLINADLIPYPTRAWPISNDYRWSDGIKKIRNFWQTEKHVSINVNLWLKLKIHLSFWFEYLTDLSVNFSIQILKKVFCTVLYDWDYMPLHM